MPETNIITKRTILDFRHAIISIWIKSSWLRGDKETRYAEVLVCGSLYIHPRDKTRQVTLDT